MAFKVEADEFSSRRHIPLTNDNTTIVVLDYGECRTSRSIICSRHQTLVGSQRQHVSPCDNHASLVRTEKYETISRRFTVVWGAALLTKAQKGKGAWVG